MSTFSSIDKDYIWNLYNHWIYHSFLTFLCTLLSSSCVKNLRVKIWFKLKVPFQLISHGRQKILFFIWLFQLEYLIRIFKISSAKKLSEYATEFTTIHFVSYKRVNIIKEIIINNQLPWELNMDKESASS